MFLKNYNRMNLRKDIPAGIIIALVSIPISMGYSQIAGLPAIYGLYGSVLPILLFGLCSSSPQFVFGVDAAPAALVGGMLATFGIAGGTKEAMAFVPVVTLMVTLWLLLFALLRAGRFTNFISTPVMGGFISGIGCEIILMQVPKLFGGTASTGELFELLHHILREAMQHFNLLSFLLGMCAIALIRFCGKRRPKVPMPVILMFAGALMSYFFPLKKYGVAMLPPVEPGLPSFSVPDWGILMSVDRHMVLASMTIALVIVAETLLATNNFAMKNNYKVNNDRELWAYMLGNLVAAFTGCCPMNGSVSRTGIAAQFGGKSQMMSLAASGTMVLILLFCTGFIGYLPVPILCAIVICALMGILEFDLAAKLRKTNRAEFIIFMAAFLGVLLLGTIYGVVIGVILSFIDVFVRAVVPPRAYLGCIPGKDGFYALDRNRNARRIQHTVIYRFSGTLFFANVGTFQEDIERAVTPDIRQVIVDGRGIGSIDITAAERLPVIYRNLEKKGVRFYMTEHPGVVNDLLYKYDDEKLLEAGMCRRHVEDALAECGLVRPYPIVAHEGDEQRIQIPYIDEKVAEYEWTFGEAANGKLIEAAEEIAEAIVELGTFDEHQMLRDLRKQAAGNWDEVNDREILHHVAEVLHRLAEESREMHRDAHGIEELQHEVEESLEEHLHHPKE